MALVKTLVASAVALCAFQAQAAITTSSSSAVPSGPVTYGFEPSDLLPSFITLSGGHVFANGDPGDTVITAKPPGAVGRWWSVGPSAPQTPTGTMTFSMGVTEVSFLWGSPDAYNTLEINGTAFNKTLLGTSLTGDRSVGVYLTVTATDGDVINSLNFTSRTNAFEMDNFRVTAVPEPETYALMLAGLGAVAFVARRRKPA